MDKKEIFYKDKEACNSPLTHVSGEPCPSALQEVDEMFGAADVLSIENSERQRRILLALSAAGTLLTMSFLLYDEANLHGLILACGVMIVFLTLILKVADRLDCHRKYIEYRVLAEALRLQFFLSTAGIGTRVADMLPWSIKQGIPWIGEVLSSLADTSLKDKSSVLDCWIRDQKAYHERALSKAKKKNLKDMRISRVIVCITVAAYVIALLFELAVYKNPPEKLNTEFVRTILKILLGTMSAVTLFTGSYYGKMSLPNVIDDHRRMIALYASAEQGIQEHGESEVLLLALAREFLNENSTWYAYQSKNTPDLVI